MNKQQPKLSRETSSSGNGSEQGRSATPTTPVAFSPAFVQAVDEFIIRLRGNVMFEQAAIFILIPML